MKIYALIYKVGVSSWYHEIIGLYDSMETLENGKEKDKKECALCRFEDNYSVEEIEINKNINIVYSEG